MGHAKRKGTLRAQHTRRGATEAVLDDSAIEAILDPRLGHADGDPIAGIRNALIVGAAVWALFIALAFI